ncbi:hypothetical protein HPB48_026032 [Haemaphysalis longicornis]|uniref:Cuticle protein n=1 Tax=Haemaphysalis longicornis TaxID=44386 RepID=A0A9J6HAE4_HAELO|nr:hypothetical protein HPB48_026032 [Haemaphysalis longicornis]
MSLLKRRPSGLNLLFPDLSVCSVCKSTHILFKRTQPPKPYSFGYDTVDEFGTQSFHNEQSDANNVKKGSYGYRDAHGIYRRVNYVADHNGFRATIDSNEPETTSGRSANAVFNSKPLAAPVAARPAAAPFDARPAAAPFAARPAAAPFAARPAAAPFDARPAAAQFAARQSCRTCRELPTHARIRAIVQALRSWFSWAR